MSFTSYGYAAPGGGIASINTQQWAQIARNLGVEYVVAGLNDLSVSIAAGDRTVQYAAGTAVGQGVMDVADTTSNTLQLAAPTTGQRWYIVGLRRDWTANAGVGATSFADFGYSTSADEASAISAALAARQQSPGVAQDDHPLAAVLIVAGQTAPQAVRDLRVWHGSGGGLVSRTQHALGFLGRVGTEINIGGTRWVRDLDTSGSPMWRTSLDRQRITLQSTHGQISPGSVGDGGYLVVAGSLVQDTNSDGLARITFPSPFPNGLLTVTYSNGDGGISRNVGAQLQFETYGGFAGLGNKNYVDYSVARPDGTRLANLRHRLNFIAIGF